MCVNFRGFSASSLHFLFYSIVIKDFYIILLCGAAALLTEEDKIKVRLNNFLQERCRIDEGTEPWNYVTEDVYLNWNGTLVGTSC